MASGTASYGAVRPKRGVTRRRPQYMRPRRRMIRETRRRERSSASGPGRPGPSISERTDSRSPRSMPGSSSEGMARMPGPAAWRADASLPHPSPQEYAIAGRGHWQPLRGKSRRMEEDSARISCGTPSSQSIAYAIPKAIPGRWPYASPAQLPAQPRRSRAKTSRPSSAYQLMLPSPVRWIVLMNCVVLAVAFMITELVAV